MVHQGGMEMHELYMNKYTTHGFTEYHFGKLSTHITTINLVERVADLIDVLYLHVWQACAVFSVHYVLLR